MPHSQLKYHQFKRKSLRFYLHTLSNAARVQIQFTKSISYSNEIIANTSLVNMSSISEHVCECDVKYLKKRSKTRIGVYDKEVSMHEFIIFIWLLLFKFRIKDENEIKNFGCGWFFSSIFEFYSWTMYQFSYSPMDVNVIKPIDWFSVNIEFYTRLLRATTTTVYRFNYS